MRTLLILCLALVISSCGLLKPKIITLKLPFPNEHQNWLSRMHRRGHPTNDKRRITRSNPASLFC